MEVFILHGLSRNIVSNRDNRFLNAFWKELFKLSGIELRPSTSYHAHTYEKNEIVDKWIEGYLRNNVLGKQ